MLATYVKKEIIRIAQLLTNANVIEKKGLPIKLKNMLLALPVTWDTFEDNAKPAKDINDKEIYPFTKGTLIGKIDNTPVKLEMLLDYTLNQYILTLGDKTYTKLSNLKEVKEILETHQAKGVPKQEKLKDFYTEFFRNRNLPKDYFNVLLDNLDPKIKEHLTGARPSARNSFSGIYLRVEKKIEDKAAHEEFHKGITPETLSHLQDKLLSFLKDDGADLTDFKVNLTKIDSPSTLGFQFSIS